MQAALECRLAGRRRSRRRPASTDPRCREARPRLASRRAAASSACSSIRSNSRSSVWASGPSARRFRQRSDRILAIRNRVDAADSRDGQPPLRLVERDPVEPRRELGALLETRQATPRAEEHLLGHLVRLARVEPKPPQRPVHAAGVLSTSSANASSSPARALRISSCSEARVARHRAVIPPAGGRHGNVGARRSGRSTAPRARASRN